MRFDLVDLRLFVAVASYGNLTRAAENFPIALGAASARIKALEESLCVSLLERGNRGVALTPQGEVFLERALAILRETEELRDDLLEFTDGTRGTIRLLANTNATHEFVPNLMMAFLVAHPKICVEMEEASSDKIVRGVDEGQAEIGLISGRVDTRSLEVTPFMKDRLVVIAPESHPLAARPATRFYRTLDWDFVGVADASSLQRWVNKSAMLLGQSIRYRIQVNNFETVCRMVSANVGIAILPESSARRIAQKVPLAIIDLEEDWAERECNVIVRCADKLSPPARNLLRFILDNL
jgi:DNA-binding transcriptional LysR family regulator